MRVNALKYLYLPLIYLFIILPDPLSASAVSSKTAIQLINNAYFVVSDKTSPPDTNAPWKAVSLTHHWSADDYQKGRNGWYQINFQLNELPSEQLGIYIRRFNMNAAIYVNDSFLTDGGSFDDPISRNWNRPLYITVPSIIWRQGANTIHIRLKSNPEYGYISPVAIGLDKVLHSEYKLQNVLQTGITTFLLPVSVAVGVFILGLWLRRRHDTQYLWFSFAVLAWSAFSLNAIIIDTQVSTKAWEWFAHICVDWWVILFVIFAHRFIDMAHFWLEKGYIAFGLIASVVYAFLGIEDIGRASNIIHAIAIIIGFTSTVIVFVSAGKSKDKYHYLVATGLLILLLGGIHDWLFQTSISGVTGRMTLHLHHYTAPLVFIFMAWHLSGRFITALNEVELLNIDLEKRIADARNELEQHYKNAAKMQQKQAISHERERLSREIHDGMSGNIANSIMLTELMSSQLDDGFSDNKDHHRSSYQDKIIQLQRQLREALTEVRNLMLTMEGDVSTLDDLSCHIKDKYQQGLLPQIKLTSQFDLINGQDTVSYKIGLNILRMTQEILNNINQHANATEVNIAIKQYDNLLSLVIADNGCGFSTDDEKKGHYGLNNLHKRCENINGTISIISGEDKRDDGKHSGCTIELQIPIQTV